MCLFHFICELEKGLSVSHRANTCAFNRTNNHFLLIDV